MSAALAYTRFELVRAFRNRRFFFFSLGFPLVLYLLIAGPNGNEDDIGGSGIPARLYFMVGLAAFGTMNGVVAAGARIAAERTIGWTRQLRITPLRPSAYIATKLVTAYAIALLTLAVLYAAGIALGVHMPLRAWLEMTGLILLGLLPFAAFGIALGHMLTIDSLGPVIGGTTALLAFLGGVWFPLGDGLMGDIGRGLPSYWLVQAGHVGIGGKGWSTTGWAVMAAWTLALTLVAVQVYRRDSGKR
jgi:ABC-2 type transport system permease protein